MGWNSQQDGKGILFDPVEDTVSEDMTLYAIYNKELETLPEKPVTPNVPEQPTNPEVPEEQEKPQQPSSPEDSYIPEKDEDETKTQEQLTNKNTQKKPQKNDDKGIQSEVEKELPHTGISNSRVLYSGIVVVIFGVLRVLKRKNVSK